MVRVATAAYGFDEEEKDDGGNGWVAPGHNGHCLVNIRRDVEAGIAGRQHEQRVPEQNKEHRQGDQQVELFAGDAQDTFDVVFFSLVALPTLTSGPYIGVYGHSGSDQSGHSVVGAALDVHVQHAQVDRSQYKRHGDKHDPQHMQHIVARNAVHEYTMTHFAIKAGIPWDESHTQVHDD